MGGNAEGYAFRPSVSSIWAGLTTVQYGTGGSGEARGGRLFYAHGAERHVLLSQSVPAKSREDLPSLSAHRFMQGILSLKQCAGRAACREDNPADREDGR